MKSAQIRQIFLDFFAGKGHQIVHSSSLVPYEDPTLLFTNAGMNQFKEVFLGVDKRPYQRATTAQKCVRAGGKHNDLENVGFTARHHTFFEMLGNFSFGDYFKRDAIAYAWELLTQVYRLPAERLWITIYSEDDEAYDLWVNVAKVPAERIIRIGDNKGARYASDNFWMMGETGPCGPCTEIFYDHGADIPGGLPGSPEEDGDRYIEIWNIVFMQFNRDEQGVMHPLPKPSVDTGMGLERMAAVLQQVHSNYQIDLFTNLIAAAARETQCQDLAAPSLRVIADHIRACSFLIADGVVPGNEGRGFVLRRIIRRAVRHGYKLGVRAPFFYRIVADLVAEMGAAYPELIAQQAQIVSRLQDEEQRFFATIEHGMQLFESHRQNLQPGQLFPGETAFRLHDTYGFPLDLTEAICKEHDIRVDSDEFERCMTAQREQARRSGKFKMKLQLEYQGADTVFHGYQTTDIKAAKILALYREQAAVSELLEGESGVVVLDNTPFYAESGGQTGDVGLLRGAQGVFAVADTHKIQTAVFGHYGTVTTGSLRLGGEVAALVNVDTRQATMRHHSATHLLHKALRDELGPHVEQKGSQVDDEKTRFDFSQPHALSAEQLLNVERRVNAQILANSTVVTRLMTLTEAQSSGATMLFGEKYADMVRVLNIGDSCELCGGTHVARTGDIGYFRIISESGVAAGIRRIEAVCGPAALAVLHHEQRILQQLAQQLKAPLPELAERVAKLLNRQQQLEKEVQHLQQQAALTVRDSLVQQAVSLSDSVHLLTATIDAADAAILRQYLDLLKDKLPTAVIVLAAVDQGKVHLAASVAKPLQDRIKAGQVVSFVASTVDGKGGGRADMATGGGSAPEKLPAALAAVGQWVQNLL